MSSCEVIDGGLLGPTLILCKISDHGPELEQLERARPAAGPGSWTDQVESYLSDCYAARAYLDRRFHPTESGALHLIYHRKDQAAELKSAYHAVRSGR